MKILFTGGESGGHFYPIVAVIQELQNIIKKERLLGVKLYFMAPNPYDKNFLFENDVIFEKVSAGKLRRYFSLQNITDIFKTGFGIIGAIFKIFSIYPDVVFGKGGYGSFPALLAAKLFRIPVIIHESDTVPGRVNMWAGKFAKRIAISYPEAAEYFPKDKVAYTGNPVRKEIMIPAESGAFEFLNLEPNVPVILVLGGSQGASLINNSILSILPDLVGHYQIIHQTGKNNFETVKETAKVVLAQSEHAERYRPFDYLNTLALRMAAGAADLVISRAGSSIFEISAWAVPSLLIPISDSNGDHQRKNAYLYARTGAANVLEEGNLTPHLIVSEIEKIMTNPELQKKMTESAKNFNRPDAAEIIAKELISIALEHEGE